MSGLYVDDTVTLMLFHLGSLVQYLPVVDGMSIMNFLIEPSPLRTRVCSRIVGNFSVVAAILKSCPLTALNEYKSRGMLSLFSV